MGLSRGGGVLVTLAALGLTPPMTLAQAPSRTGNQAQAPAAPDSAEVHGAARALQARFERHRLRHLPRGLSGSGGRCDEVIGRLCIWDGGSAGWTPRPEAPEIVEARMALIASLDSLATLTPANAWILGQRIRYRLETGAWDDAVAAARRCGVPDTWVCQAYEGLARHQAGRIRLAEGLFAQALAAMPPDRAREWRDPEPLLDGALRDWLEVRSGTEDGVETLWRWADPLFLVEGNDRWTGHLSRWAHAMSSEDTRSPHQMRWGPDLTESVIRYGWTVAWERSWPRGGETQSSSAIGHDPPAALRFFPDRAVLEPDEDVPGQGMPWVLDRKGMKTLYLPPYLDSLAQPDAQIARFTRSRGVVVMAAAPWAAGPDAGAGLFVDTGVPPVLAGTAGVAVGKVWGAVVIDSLPGSRRSGLVSLEALDREGRTAQRTRTVLELLPVPPDVLSLSDVVLLEAGPEPTALDELPARMLPGTEVAPLDTVTLAFQVSGLGYRAEAVSFRVVMERRDRGLLSRVGDWVGLGDDGEPLSITWTESGPRAPGSVLRALEVVLPDVEDGLWDLVVGVRTPGRSEAVSRRTVRVRVPVS